MVVALAAELLNLLAMECRALAIMLLLLTPSTFSATAHATFIDNASTAISPYNRRRPPLNPSEVQFIVLHTTEGKYPGCLNKLQQRGEAHFLVLETGRVIRIMDINKLAKHAGRSMWNNSRGLDQIAIGIEVEGTYSIPPNIAQRASLKELLADLKDRFNVPDERILTHSMVAYGVPNRYWADDHRGRKRCGMMMARAEVRADLGLTTGAHEDPDVNEARLIVADEPLFAFLYNPLATALIFTHAYHAKVREFLAQLHIPRAALVGAGPAYRPESIVAKLPRPTTTSAAEPVPLPPPRPADLFPVAVNGTPEPSPTGIAAEDQDAHDGDVEVMLTTVDGEAAFAYAGYKYNSPTTIYFFANGMIRTGQQLADSKTEVLNHLPALTKILVGYVYGGKVTATRTATSIVGRRWSDPSTVYHMPDRSLKTGDEVDPRKIQPGTIVLFQK